MIIRVPLHGPHPLTVVLPEDPDKVWVLPHPSRPVVTSFTVRSARGTKRGRVVPLWLQPYDVLYWGDLFNFLGVNGNGGWMESVGTIVVHRPGSPVTLSANSSKSRKAWKMVAGTISGLSREINAFNYIRARANNDTAFQRHCLNWYQESEIGIASLLATDGHRKFARDFVELLIRRDPSGLADEDIDALMGYPDLYAPYLGTLRRNDNDTP